MLRELFHRAFRYQAPPIEEYEPDDKAEERQRVMDRLDAVERYLKAEHQDRIDAIERAYQAEIRFWRKE